MSRKKESIKFEQYMNVDKKIKEYRIKNKLTQEQLADKLGLSRSFITRLELGHYKDISYKTFKKLEKIIK